MTSQHPVVSVGREHLLSMYFGALDELRFAVEEANRYRTICEEEWDRRKREPGTPVVNRDRENHQYEHWLRMVEVGKRAVDGYGIALRRLPSLVLDEVEQ